MVHKVMPKLQNRLADHWWHNSKRATFLSRSISHVCILKKGVSHVWELGFDEVSISQLRFLFVKLTYPLTLTPRAPAAEREQKRNNRRPLTRYSLCPITSNNLLHAPSWSAWSVLSRTPLVLNNTVRLLITLRTTIIGQVTYIFPRRVKTPSIILY